MKGISRLDYAYAVGRVRSLENFLITRAVFEQAAAAGSPAEAMKTLVDAGRFREERIDFLEGSREVDGYLDEELRWFWKDICSLFLEDVYLHILQAHRDPSKMRELAEDSICPFVRQYVRAVLDLKNIKLFLRGRYLGLPLEEVASRFLPGGQIETSRFIDLYSAADGEVSEALHATPYRLLWDRAVDSLGEWKSFRELERGSEDLLMKHLRKARQIVFGPEPVFAYVLARLKELSMVRMIAVGKILSVPAQTLISRVSETYV